MPGETELNVLLKEMSPKLQSGKFVFLTFSVKDDKYGDYAELDPICFYREEEGITLIVPEEKAVAGKVPFEEVFKVLTLTVHSSLEAVGLTGAIASKLAADGISANVVAAFYHDHIFVQAKYAERALESLEELVKEAKVQYAYNRNSEQYIEKVSTNKDYQGQIEHFASLLPGNSHVLDLGCGPGVNSQIIAGNGHKVEGIDLSATMIDLAKKSCPSGSFEVDSVIDYQSDQKFDGVLLSFIIVHLEEREKLQLFKNLNTMLLPNGKLFISYMTGKEPGWESTSFSPDPIFFNYYNKEEICKELSSYGFNKIYEKIVPYNELNGTSTDDIFQIYEYRVL